MTSALYGVGYKFGNGFYSGLEIVFSFIIVIQINYKARFEYHFALKLPCHQGAYWETVAPKII